MSTAGQNPVLNHPYVQKAKGLACRYRKPLGAVAVLIVLFGLLGYFWLPGFAKGKVEALLSEKLHRPVTVERIDISPYTLELTVHGFRIGERPEEGEGALFSFDSLYVNLSSMSIARGAPVISAVKLSGPAVRLVRKADGSLSIDDLIEEFSNQPESEPTLFSVSNIEVEKGRIDFEDRVKKVNQEIDTLMLGIPFVANFESAEKTWVQPYFTARLNQGTAIAMEGKVLPFADHREVVLNIAVDALDLNDMDEYIPLPKGMHLKSAKVDTKVDVSFTQAPGKTPQISLNGDITLRDLALDNRADLPWSLKSERLVLNLDAVDPLLTRPLKVGLAGTEVRFKQGSFPELRVNTLALTGVEVDVPKHQAAFALDATINSNGKLKVGGNAGWAPVAADVRIDAESVDIVALQGFAAGKLNALLTKGAVSFGGQIKAAGTPLNVAVNGDARVSDFNMLDKANDNDLLRWRSLDVAGIALNTAPLKVDIEKISLADFFARIVLSPEGKLNLKDITVQQTAAQSAAPTEAVPEKTTEKTATGTATTAPVDDKAEALPVRIGQILIQGGNINFNDRFVKPNYRANLTKLDGKIGPLDPGKPGLIEIRGSIDRTAPLEIKGKVDPFGKELFVDMTAKAKGIDLPTFSPYSGRHVGYAIEKGKLSVDLHYFVEKGELRAENNIFIDQLTFGEKVESPDALSLPVNLAVALLKNSRGEIDLNLPISGSLNDPQFSVGGVIVKVILNLIVKAVTSPFALLGSIFGGGADLSQIGFVPGYARLTPDAEKSLDAVSKAMIDRPALKLEITGVADAVNDREGLKRAVLERRVKSQKLADLAKQGQAGGTLSEVTISAAEYPKYLELAYNAEKFEGKPRNLIGMNKSLPVPDMEQLMLANLPAGDDEMRSLAERRARAARESLIAKGVPTERVFVLQPKVETQTDGKKLAGRVDFSLR